MYPLHTCAKPTYFCKTVALFSMTSEECLGCSVFLQLFFITSYILQCGCEHTEEGLSKRIILPSVHLPLSVCVFAQQAKVWPIVSLLLHTRTALEKMLNHKLSFCKLFLWSPVSAAFGHNVSKTISSGEKLGHIQAFTSSNADINKIAVCAQSFVIITKIGPAPSYHMC